MEDTTKKTKRQLIEELEALRQRVDQLERASYREPTQGLTREDRLFLDIVEQAPFSMWASKCIAGNYEIVLWNRGAAEIYQFSKEEAIGSNYLTLFVSDEERVQSAIDCDKIIEEGEVFRNFLAYDEAKDGTRRAVLTNCFRIWDEDEGECLQAEMALLVPELEPVIEEHRKIREAGIRQLAQVTTSRDLLRRIGSITVAITSTIPEERELTRVLRRIAESVKELIYESTAELAEEEVSSIICVYEEGSAEPVCVIDTKSSSPVAHIQPDMDCLGSYAMRTGTALFLDGSHKLPDDLFEGHDWPLYGRDHSLAVLPVVFGDNVLGVLFVEAKKRYAFPVEVELALKLFAEQTAMAIHVQRLSQLIGEEQEASARSMIAMDFVHRINNLGGTIPGWIDMMREWLFPSDPRDEQLQGYLDKIERDIRRLMQEAQKLLEPLEAEVVDIGFLLKGMLNTVDIMYPEISIEDNLDEVDLCPVRAIRPQLSSAIWNVVNNALEAMSDQGGILSLEASNVIIRDSNWVRISIGDTGPGIPSDQMDKIYDLRYSTKEGANLGYGLWRSKRVIEDLKGSITVESEVGVGATFITMLPALSSS